MIWSTFGQRKTLPPFFFSIFVLEVATRAMFASIFSMLFFRAVTVMVFNLAFSMFISSVFKQVAQEWHAYSCCCQLLREVAEQGTHALLRLTMSIEYHRNE